MAGWAMVPIFQGSGVPTAIQIEGEGLEIGYNTASRDGWIIASNDVPFCKCAYYKSGGYYYIVAAVKADTALSSMKLYIALYTSSYYVGSKSFDHAYGDFLDTGNGSYEQTIEDKRNPAIPAYNSYQEALDALNDGVWEDPGNDPYGPGGGSGPGGGTGTFDGTGDDIDIPSLPTLSASDTGFITLFNPSIAQLKALANYMWSSGFDLDTFKKIFANPMDAVLGLSIVPVAVPNSGTRAVVVGNISTGVSMSVASTQYVSVDCGTLNVEEYWGAYLDYDPYTKCHIYLPYIGTHPIATDDIMGKSVHVVYHIDILSGACAAFVKCGGSVLYEFIGQVASSIPITGDNFTNVINGVLNIAGSIGTMVATGGFSAPASVAKAGLAGAYTAGHMIGTAASLAQDVMSMKPQVEKSGGMSGTGGMLGVQTPYMILERPRQAIPNKQNEYMGYPAFITAALSDLSGYTEVEHIHLDNIPCTELELNEILGYLESGVIL